jgi:hypothetical protein
MSTKLAEKGKQGFIPKRKNKVFDYLMRRNNVTLYAVARAFNLTEQSALRYIHNPFTMDLNQLLALATLFHIKPSVMFELLYCNYTTIPPHIEKEIEEDVLSLSKEIGLI